MKKTKILLLILSVIPLLAGCWDSLEIEERGFLVGIAVDLLEKQDNGSYQLEMTEQIVNPAGLGTPGGTGGQTPAFINVSASGTSLYDINSKITEKSSRVPSPQHLIIIPVSEDVAKEEELFADVMDVFLRQQHMRRGIKVVIVQGEAKRILDVQPDIENFPAQYMEAIMESSAKNPTIIEAVTAGDIHEYLLKEKSFILPRMSITEESEIKYEGVAVFRGDSSQMVGSLNGRETRGLNFIKGDHQQGALPVDWDGKETVINVGKAGSKLTLEEEHEDKLVFSLDITVGGTIAETFSNQDIFQGKNREDLIRVMEDEVKKVAEDTISKVQEELKVDAFDFSSHLQQHHYKLWKRIEDHWDKGKNIFSNSDIKVTVKGEIYQPGNINQTKGNEEGG
ncbi:Ger(x)C family spore germination protein [Virgibacillus sediminis]|uniref:Ger(X)C family spore germination protein n=1 Tax=Virgibacillus sediminis TaxID=202260 RepID=A0ABV7A8L6_9BACI